MKFRNMARRYGAVLLGSVAVPAVSLAAAVPVTTTEAVEQIGQINIAVAAVGGALLIAAAIAVAFKWGKAAVFG